MLTAVAHGLLDLLAPRCCAGCDDELDPGAEGFCPGCEPLIEPLDPLATMGAAYVYQGPLAAAIQRWKYGGRLDLTPPLGALIARGARCHVGEVDVVVPVPLHPRRLCARGFDQAGLLAARVARELGVPLRRSLQRIRDTPAQAGRAAAERALNVRGCFAPSMQLSGRALLVDDVRTTGVTFAEAALAARQAGALEVRFIALAGAER